MVGSRHEGYGETGMAHLLEHMLFMGTPGHPDIMQELTERGAQPNGTTWFDRTNYFEVFPASLGQSRLGTRSRSRSDAQLVREKRGPRVRNDSCPE